MDVEIPVQLLVRMHVLVWTFALTLTFLVMICTYLIPAMRKPGFFSEAWVRAGIAVSAFALGTMIRAGWVSSFLIQFTRTGHNTIADKTWEIDVFAGVITVLGLLFLHFTFAPEGFERRWALVALVFAAIVDGIVWLV